MADNFAGNIKLGVDVVLNKRSLAKMQKDLLRTSIDPNQLNAEGQKLYAQQAKKFEQQTQQVKSKLTTPANTKGRHEQELKQAQAKLEQAQIDVPKRVAELQGKTGRQIFYEQTGTIFPQNQRMSPQIKKEAIANAQKELIDAEKTVAEKELLIAEDEKELAEIHKQIRLATKQEQKSKEEAFLELKRGGYGIQTNLTQDDFAKSRDGRDSDAELSAAGQQREELIKLKDTIDSIKASMAKGIGDPAAQQAVLAQLQPQLDKMISRFELAKNGYADMVDGASNLGKALRGVVAILGVSAEKTKAWLSAFARLGKNVNKTSADVKKTLGRSVKNLSRAVLGVRSIYMVIRRLRDILIKGLNTLAIQFPEINAELSQMRTLWEQVKGSLGTLIQPLVSALLPVLNTVMSSVSSIAERLGSVFASLTGQGYIYKATANWQDYAAAVAGANKKLGAYDKLNTIGDNNNVLDVTYSKEPIEDSISSFIETLKNLWSSGDYAGVGSLIGSTIASWLNDIPWGDIQAKITDIVTKINGVLTGLLGNPEFATSVGVALGNLINTVLGLIGTFFNIFPWSELGSSIATGLDSALKQIDIDKLAEAINGFAQAIVDVLLGFFSNPDWAFTLATKIVETLGKVDWATLLSAALLLFLPGLISTLLGLLATHVKTGILSWLTTSIIPMLSSGLDTILINLLVFFQDTLPALFATFGTWITGTVLPFLASVGSAILAALPYVLIAAAIVAIIALIIKYWDDIVAWLKTAGEEIGKFFSELWDATVQWFKDLNDNITEWLNNTVNSIINKFKDMKEKWVALWNALGEALGHPLEKIKSILKSVFDWIGNFFKSRINARISWFNLVIKAVLSIVNKLIEKLNSFKINVPSWVTKLTGVSTFGFNLKTISIPQIPLLAQGAVIPPNKQFLAMLGDQTHGTNIEAPLETIKQAVAEVVGTTGNQPIILQVDGKTLAKVVWDENEKRYKQVGKSYAY